MGFDEALQRIKFGGKRVTRYLASPTYVCIKDGNLMFFDGQSETEYQPTNADILATDWQLSQDMEHHG